MRLVCRKFWTRSLKRGSRSISPIILFSYYNPVVSVWSKASREAAKGCRGLDGVLVLTSSPEEAGEFERELRACDLDMIFLVAPTSTDERLKLRRRTRERVYLCGFTCRCNGTRETVKTPKPRSS
jgi:tryptophan synthase alpha subunit